MPIDGGERLTAQIMIPDIGIFIGTRTNEYSSARHYTIGRAMRQMRLPIWL